MHTCGPRSFHFILEPKVYITIRFIKNNGTIEKFKEIYLKFKKETRIKKDLSFIFNGNIIDLDKTVRELGIKNNNNILVKEINIDKNSSEEEEINNSDKINNSNQKDNKVETKIEPKKYDLNILYYDENLLNKENSNNCSFLDMNINGTFYGCHYFDLFKIVCDKIKNKNKEFILIASGSCPQNIINYC